MNYLTEHFTLEELIASDTAKEKGIDNTPSPEIVDALVSTARHLEQVRALFGRPLVITSGYRCPELNRAVGGVWDSAHVRGVAADIHVPGLTLEWVYNTIRASTLQYDQLIYEGTWIHIGFDVSMRRQNLTAHFGPNGVTYTVTP